MSSLTDKQRVLAATDLVRLIGEQVTLKRKGREYTCLCPFHNDHNPSMYVVPSKQIYHCFVCGAGGDALKFAMDYFKMEFREALTLLADRAGITLSPPKRRETMIDGLPTEGEEVSRAAILNASAHDPDRQLTLAFDKNTGKQLWEAKVHAGGLIAGCHWRSLWAASVGERSRSVEP